MPTASTAVAPSAVQTRTRRTATATASAPAPAPPPAAVRRPTTRTTTAAAPSTRTAATSTAKTRTTATTTTTASASNTTTRPRTPVKRTATAQTSTAAASTAAPKAAPKSTEETVSNPNTTRLTALKAECTTAHNEGSKFYTDRNFKDAIPFFLRAIQLAQDVESQYAILREDASEAQTAALDAALLQWQRFNMRRLDILAACYRMSGQGVLYFQTTREAFRAMPRSQIEELGNLLNNTGLSEAFALQEWSRLTAMARMWFDTACFDTQSTTAEWDGTPFDGDAFYRLNTDLENGFNLGTHRAEDDRALASCHAALLEHYMNTSLELNLHREHVPDICANLWKFCRTVYDDRLPIRRARAHMRFLEIRLLTSPPEREASLLHDLAKVLQDLEGIPGDDDGLRTFVPQYMASAYLLRISILHHHHGTIPTDGGLDLDETVERATLLLQQVLDACEHGRVPPATASKGRVSLRPTARGNVVEAPVTPPRQVKPTPALSGGNANANVRRVGAAAVEGPSKSTVTSTTTKSPLDDPARLCAQIEMCCEMLSASGHGLSVLRLLRMLRRLHQVEAIKSQLDRNGYYRCCAQLASIYLSLGQVSRAKEMLGEAQKVLRMQDSESAGAGSGSGSKAVAVVVVSPDTQVRCLMAEVELYVALGDVPTAKTSYESAIRIGQTIRGVKQQYVWQAGLEQFQKLERQALAAQACARLRLGMGGLDGAIQAENLCCRLWYKLSSLIGMLTGEDAKEGVSGGGGRRGPKSSSGSSGERSRSGAIPGVEDPFGPAPGSEEDEEEKAKAKAKAAIDSKEGAQHAPPAAEEIVPTKKPALQHDTRIFPSQAMVGVYWRCGGNLIDSLLRCSQLLLTRGSGRDAELMAIEAADTASALDVPMSLSRALLQRAEVRLLMGRMDEGNADLSRARELLKDCSGAPEAVETARICGDAQLRAKAASEAVRSFGQGQAVLEQMDAMYSCVETVMLSPAVKRSKVVVGSEGMVSIPPDRALLPNAQARLLIRQAQAMLLKNDRAASASLLERVLSLPITADVELQSKNVLGQVALQHAVRSLSKHQVLNSLVDSVVSSPMISQSSKTVPANGVKAVVKALVSAHGAFTEAIHSGCGVSDATLLREAVGSQALVVAVLHALEVGSKASAQRGDIASTMNFGSSVTVLREYMEAIGNKLSWGELSLEEPKWLGAVPALDGQQVGRGKGKGLALFAPKVDKVDTFWSGVYAQGVQASLAGDNVEIPPNWSVVNISFVKARNALLVSRQGGGHRPLSVHLPVDRMSRREGEEEHLSIEAAIEQMRALTAAINSGIHGVKDVEGREGKILWWEGRRSLDKELEELMTTMETTWLGAFKSVLAEPTRASDEDVATLRDKLAGVLKHACAPSTKAGVNIKLDRVVVECIARLRPDMATDEDLEDVIHFVMDAFQVGGAPVAVDEVDIDDCVVEVRSALEEFWSRQNKAASEGARRPDDDHHLFLVLDKDACAFPWESLALLRDRPVSRIPSVRFLQDRIKMAPLFCPEQREDAAENGRYYDLANPRTFWLLNPGGDLKRTEGRLAPWLAKKQRHDGWRGITGRMPIVDELPKALEENDVLTYFGHGGAEMYIRSTRIRKLKRCAVTMLWGCSSGFLRDQGELERAGTPYNYMLAGSPALVANLWDMTDLELDRLCETVFCKLGMMDEGDRAAKSLVPAGGPNGGGGGGGGGGRAMSLTRAVAESRRDCRLPYLSGGACITYGVPVYFGSAASS
ncbi:hypothetical protein CF319_g3903 [Tilletia indica]|nr:hypothetical protein CF319_g3903 [Tilletia indica]